MKRSAVRTAIKFVLCGVIAVFGASAVILGDNSGTIKPFLWTVACGVCIALLWPSQDEGDELLKRDDDP
jgi:hypothetical protein